MSITLASTALASSAAIAPTASVSLSANSSSADESTDEEVLGTSSQAIIACNSISVAACVLVIVIYGLLYRKHTRLMQRTSLVLSVAMSVSDLLLHATNLVGYFNLPDGFACQFVGGWMFAFPTLLSVFYSCCIALNSQLYFVFRREPSGPENGVGSLLKWYIFTPIAVSGIICFSALGAGLYGYDSVYGYCWFATPPPDPDHPHQRLLRPLIGMLTTFGGWCLLALLYLLIASSTVAWVVFWKSQDVDFGGHIGLRRNRRKFTSESVMSAPSVSIPRWTGHGNMSSTDVVTEGPEKASLTPQDDLNSGSKTIPSDIHNDSEMELGAENNEEAGGRDWNIHIFPPRPRHTPGVAHSQRIDASTTAPTAHKERPKISRRTLALRAMTLRLIGYILIPVICILPGSIKDLIIKSYPVGEVQLSDALSGLFDGLNGLVGLFNAVLFLVDPVLLIVWAELRAKHRWGRLQRQRTEAQDIDEENRAAIEVDAIAESPVREAETPRSDGGDGQVGGIRSTHFGKEDNQQSAKRAFGDSLISSLQSVDNEGRSRGAARVAPRLMKGMGRRKRQESARSGGAGLMIHVQVEVAKCSDLERVEDYLHGL